MFLMSEVGTLWAYFECAHHEVAWCICFTHKGQLKWSWTEFILCDKNAFLSIISNRTSTNMVIQFKMCLALFQHNMTVYTFNIIKVIHMDTLKWDTQNEISMIFW